MFIDEINFCISYIIMYSILVKQVMRIKNLERRIIMEPYTMYAVIAGFGHSTIFLK